MAWTILRPSASARPPRRARPSRPRRRDPPRPASATTAPRRDRPPTGCALGTERPRIPTAARAPATTSGSRGSSARTVKHRPRHPSPHQPRTMRNDPLTPHSSLAPAAIAEPGELSRLVETERPALVVLEPTDIAKISGGGVEPQVPTRTLRFGFDVGSSSPRTIGDRESGCLGKWQKFRVAKRLRQL